MNIKHIIWDWNGTLLNDNWLAVKAINISLKRYKLPLIDHEQYLELFSFPVIDYYKKLGFNFDRTPFNVVGTEFIEEYTKYMYDAKLQDGALDVLNYFDKKGISQSLLSAAKQEMLDDIIERHNLVKYFNRISGLSDHYANSKAGAGIALIQELDCEPHQALMIGDTMHDVEVADKIGTQCVLIAQGHATYERLKSSDKLVFHNLIEFKKWYANQ